VCLHHVPEAGDRMFLSSVLWIAQHLVYCNNHTEEILRKLFPAASPDMGMHVWNQNASALNVNVPGCTYVHVCILVIQAAPTRTQFCTD
jgi:hypothetical protein